MAYLKKDNYLCISCTPIFYTLLQKNNETTENDTGKLRLIGVQLTQVEHP